MYTVDYYISKFEAIPEYLWIIGTWGNYDKHCSGGHCGCRTNNLVTNEFTALEKLLRQLVITQIIYDGGELYSDYITVVINDKMAKEYQQPTAKQRILAALQDVRKMQQPQYPDIRKDLAKFEIGDKTDLPVLVTH